MLLLLVVSCEMMEVVWWSIFRMLTKLGVHSLAALEAAATASNSTIYLVGTYSGYVLSH
jgi:hypothetical protein